MPKSPGRWLSEVPPCFRAMLSPCRETATFVLNAVGWLQGDEDKVTIRPVERSLRQTYVPGGEALAIFLGTVVLLPVIFLIAGGVIWWRRRRA